MIERHCGNGAPSVEKGGKSGSPLRNSGRSGARGGYRRWQGAVLCVSVTFTDDYSSDGGCDVLDTATSSRWGYFPLL